MIKVAASILNADFGHLAAEIKRVETAGAKLLHLDIMDGHFVPNLTMGPQVIAGLRPHTTMEFEVHLMVTHPEKFYQPFIAAGGHLVLFHQEAVAQPQSLLADIRKAEARAGLVINPETPAEAVFPFLDKVDQVLLMSVNPGFGGQDFIPGTLPKIEELARRRRDKNLTFQIEVDGGVNQQTGRLCREAGADILVVGTYLFRSPDIKRAVQSLQS